MQKKTKARILDEALVMFAKNGYKGTNLRDLAAQLGLSKSALYKHYDSKEAIFNALLDGIEEYYDERINMIGNMFSVPKSCDDLAEMSMKMIDFTVHDSRIVMTRRILLTEQFHNERVRGLATLHFLTGTERVYTAVFEKMIEDGILKEADPSMLAFAYTSPITSLVHLCDREPQRESEILERAQNFIRHFIEVYGNK